MLEIKVPLIPGNKKGIVGKIDIVVGDLVEKDQVLCHVETAKGNRQIKAIEKGIINKILVEEGDEVSSNEILILLSDENETVESFNKKDNIENTDNKNNTEKSKEIEKEIDKEIEKETYIDRDLVIIGAGPGGYYGAIYASKRGLKVTLIEKENFGGTCLNVGCIPTKSLVQSMSIYESLKDMDLFGVNVDSNISLNLSKVNNRKNDVVNTLVSGVKYLLEKNNVEVIKGEAYFIDNHIIKVGNLSIRAKDIIIATGSIKSILPIKGNDLKGVIDSTDALNVDTIPSSMTVIGGGVIGMEFSFIYNAFGSKINIIEFKDNLLPMMDRDAGVYMENICKEKGINVYTSSKVLSIEETIEKKYIVTFEKEGKIYKTISDKVLMATGRKANIENLRLFNTSIKVNEKNGNILVDKYKKTTLDHVYAIGDVSSNLKLAHLAYHEAMVSIDYILGEKRELKEENIPSVVYTDPEIAQVGYSEEELIRKGIKFKSSKYDFHGNGKALIMNKNKGFIKILYSNDYKILGGLIVGPDASALISSIAIIITNNISIYDIVNTVFPHPTTAEVIHEVFMNAIGRGVHN